MTYFLAADIGGTKTDLAIFDTDQGLGLPLFPATLINQNYESFSLLLASFLKKISIQPECACFGVAGPVLGNRVKLTNLPWEIAASDIYGQFHLKKIDIINDLVALANAVPHLSDADLVVIHAATSREKGTVGVVAPGTGLGIAFCVWGPGNYIVCPSEGGHAGFSPADEDELELLRYLFSEGINTSFESLCSGSGLPNIYRFLLHSGRFVETEWVGEEMSMKADPTPVIIKAALDATKQCPVCLEAVRLFTVILAEICGNLAVTVLATGGLYIGGGIPPRILSLLNRKEFVHRYTRKGKMFDLVRSIPVAVITNPKAALIGAAAYGLRVHDSK